MKILIRAACAALQVASWMLVVSCTSTTPMPADGVPEPDEIASYRERFADDLRGEVEVERPILERTSAELLSVRVPLRNVSGYDLLLLVQVQFVDDSGVPNGDETNRQSFSLPRGSSKVFSATSRTSSAADYVMYLWRVDQ